MQLWRNKKAPGPTDLIILRMRGWAQFLSNMHLQTLLEGRHELQDQMVLQHNSIQLTSSLSDK